PRKDISQLSALLGLTRSVDAAPPERPFGAGRVAAFRISQPILDLRPGGRAFCSAIFVRASLCRSRTNRPTPSAVLPFIPHSPTLLHRERFGFLRNWLPTWRSASSPCVPRPHANRPRKLCGRVSFIWRKRKG